MKTESEEADLLHKDGFQIEEIHHYYKGICPECLNEKMKINACKWQIKYY